jgi:hypothetical protein
MTAQAKDAAVALLHGAHAHLSGTTDRPRHVPASELTVKVALVSWLITPAGELPSAPAVGESVEVDLVDALHLLVHDVDHHDLPIDVLVTARRWLHELVEDHLPLVSS